MAGNKTPEAGDSKMTIEESLLSALEVFEIPVEAEIYQGDAEKYIVFNYTSNPDNFADDTPQNERYLIQVHLYASPGSNTRELQQKIKKALFETGISWPQREDASDQYWQHIVFECEYVGEIDYGEG